MRFDLVILSTVDPDWIAKSADAFELPSLLDEAKNLGLRPKVIHPNACTVVLPVDEVSARVRVDDQDISVPRFVMVYGAAVTLPATQLICTIFQDSTSILLDPLEVAEQAIAGKGGQMYRCAMVRTGMSATVEFSIEGLVRSIKSFDFSDGRSLVIKPNKGARGSGVMQIRRAEDAAKAAEFYQNNGYVAFLLEEFVDIETEYRALTLDGRIIACARKTPPSGAFLGNAAAGAEFTAEALPKSCGDKLELMPVRGLAGIDIALDQTGRAFLIEINRQPQWRMLQQATDVIIAKEILEHLLEREKRGSPAVRAP